MTRRIVYVPTSVRAGSRFARVYFQPSSLFDTLVILTLITGGIGLVARSLREMPQQ